MNQHSSLKPSGSLLERAAELYGFGTAMRAPEPAAPPAQPEARPAPPPEDDFFAASAPPAEAEAEAVSVPENDFFEVTGPPVRQKPQKRPIIVRGPEPEPEVTGGEDWLAPKIEPAPAPQWTAGPAAEVQAGRRGIIDRDSLREGGFILPDAPVSGLAEEFRIVKRQLLQAASGKTGITEDKRQTILVCSAAPNEGKTFCAINLALSMASEKDVEVLLVDGDFSKPEILSILGLEGGPGLTDAIADPYADPESYVIQTDVEGLSVLPAGSHRNNVTELLASQRTRSVLDALTAEYPNRIVIFDSPPALMASPATILSNKVGQVVMVVRADRTKETDLREAVGLISGCEHLSLMLNGTGFAPSGPRFGSYYGYRQ